MNHGQSNASMATTRTENTHGLTYTVARAIDINLSNLSIPFVFIA